MAKAKRPKRKRQPPLIEKRGGAKKKKRKQSKPVVGADLEAARSHLKSVQSTVGAMFPLMERAIVDSLGQDEVPQEILDAMDRVATVVDQMNTLHSAFKRRLLERAADGVKFQDGDVIVKIEESTRRTPSWKQEAIKQAEVAAEALGSLFVEETYVAGVMENAKVSKTKRLKLIRKD